MVHVVGDLDLQFYLYHTSSISSTLAKVARKNTLFVCTPACTCMIVPKP